MLNTRESKDFQKKWCYFHFFDFVFVILLLPVGPYLACFNLNMFKLKYNHFISFKKILHKKKLRMTQYLRVYFLTYNDKLGN